MSNLKRAVKYTGKWTITPLESYVVCHIPVPEYCTGQLDCKSSCQKAHCHFVKTLGHRCLAVHCHQWLHCVEELPITQGVQRQFSSNTIIHLCHQSESGKSDYTQKHRLLRQILLLWVEGLACQTTNPVCWPPFYSPLPGSGKTNPRKHCMLFVWHIPIRQLVTICSHRNINNAVETGGI